MARVPTKKHLVNSRLLKEYASWVYCGGCNKTVAYLCYVTYDSFEFDYTCNCGSKGQVQIAFGGVGGAKLSDEPLLMLKNRLCCPADQSPLVTFVEKNLESFRCSIVCKGCTTQYTAAK